MTRRTKYNYDDVKATVVALTEQPGIKAGEKVSACIMCNEYCKLKEMGVKTGEGFSHYIIKSWSR